MHLEILVEETSAEVALSNLLPKILVTEATFAIHPYQGKKDLQKKLPGKLKGYRRWIPDDWRIVVLIDEDRQDCHQLKGLLEKIASQAGFTTKSKAGGEPGFEVINRIAVEELEAWFFGDVEAITVAYPGVPELLAEKAQYRQPDSIRGGTWEALWKVLKKAGYYSQRYPKIEVARSVSAEMKIEGNRSRSFQVFVEALRAVA